MALTHSKVREVPAHIDEKAVSWLRLAPPPKRPETTTLFERSTAKLGYVRNMQYVLAQFPALLQAQDALSRSLTVEFDGGLSHKERELIALVVSVHNRCEPCVFGHAAKLREITGDRVRVGKVEINYRRAKLTARERRHRRLRCQDYPRAGRDRARRSG